MLHENIATTDEPTLKCWVAALWLRCSEWNVRFGPIADMERESKVHAWLQAYAYLDVASGSIPLFLIVSEARAEARNSISRLEPSMSPELATTAAENV